MAFQMRLMADIRLQIEAGTFPDFVRRFMFSFYKERIESGLGGGRFGGGNSSCTEDGVSRKRKKSQSSSNQVETITASSASSSSLDPGKLFHSSGYPNWIVNALKSVSIDLL